MLLHVVEPIYYDYPTTREIRDHAAELPETNTPQGLHLRHALDSAQEAGIATSLKVRHGDIVHEIAAEMHAGQYDLVAMGSPVSSHSLRNLYKPNVAARVSETALLPVLIAELEQQCIGQGLHCFP